MDGGLSLFGEILITTSPAKFGKKFEKCYKILRHRKFLLLYVMICTESSKKIVNAFVQIELCHMKNAFMATIFDTI